MDTNWEFQEKKSFKQREIQMNYHNNLLEVEI